MKQLFAMALLMTTPLLSATTFFDMEPHKVREIIDAKIMKQEGITLQVDSVEEYTLEVEDRVTPLRIYSPGAEENYPIILFIHGGAWVAGNLDTHDNLARYLCSKTNSTVVSVGYLNSPEGKFPLPMEQCYDALNWAAAKSVSAPIAVVGDSAGGNMAAALCLMARDRNGPLITYQVLLNPAPDLSCGGTLTYQNDALDIMRLQAKLYAQSEDDLFNPYFSPLQAKDHTRLPPALIVLAEKDDLYADGLAYAEKLLEANVDVKIFTQLNIGHLAGNGARVSKAAKESVDVTCDSLNAIFMRCYE